MSSTRNLANAVGGKTARACDSCIRKRARWYCAADDAFLCQACDSSVHSANSLARRHERVRLTSASCKPPPDSNNSSPSWLGGFTRKARTPRPAKPTLRRPKSDDLISLLSNPSFSPVPETDETTTSHEENEEDQLLFRVPTFDPFFADNQTKVVDAGNLHGFLPTDMDLAEFAADVESLLGRNLESECFDMEGLGLMDCKEEDDMAAAEEDDMARGCSFGGGRVKVEDEEACGQQFDAEIDLMREPFELNFEDYDDAPGSCCEEDEKIIPVMATTVLVGVKNEGGDYADESKTNKKRKVTLRLDWAAVIAAWGSEKSPWTTGERPDFNPDDGWPDCMATCGVNYRHSCGEYGVMGGLLPAAIADGGREARVSRYREKRRTRLFSKKIRYEVRKLNAEKRPRMKGRFVKRTPFAQPPPLPMLSIK